MTDSCQDISRRAATAIVATFSLSFIAVLFSCAPFGLPSTERILAVYGEPRFSDADIEWMTTAWKKLEESEGSSREILNAGLSNDTTRLSQREIDRIRALRRMALYTTEPDEMHVPLALGRMKPKQLDFNPHFFQYGGFFFYGCGLLAGIAGLLGLVPLSGGLDPYVRDPDLMANFYLAAKIWPFFWSALLPVFVYRLARLGISRKRSCLAVLLALSAPGLYVFGPVLKQVSMAGSISVMATWLGSRLIRRAGLFDYAAAGAAVGLAGAIFPTQLILMGGLCWVALEIILRDRALVWKRYIAACGAAGAVFFLCNPYWILDYRTVMSDAKHAMAWYRPDVNFATVSRVLFEVFPAATGWPLAACGSIAILWLLGNFSARCIAAYSLAPLLYYGWRITGVPDLGPFWSRQFLMVGPLWAVLFLMALKRVRFSATVLIAAVCILVALPYSVLAVVNFRKDATTESTRFLAGRWIDTNVPEGDTVYITQQPGPFSTPFFNLNRHPVKPAASPDSMPVGALVISVAEPNTYGNEQFFEAMKLEKEFPSERMLFGLGPYPEAIGFANGPVRIWRRGHSPTLPHSE